MTRLAAALCALVLLLGCGPDEIVMRRIAMEELIDKGVDPAKAACAAGLATPTFCACSTVKP